MTQIYYTDRYRSRYVRAREKHVFLNIMIGLVFSIFLISLGTIFVLNWRGFYYFEIKNLNLVQQTGYPDSVIRSNYNALIDYCSPLFSGVLTFPTLPSSTTAMVHFSEVKQIFLWMYWVAFLTLLCSILILWLKHKVRDYRYLKITAWTTLLIPAILAVFMSIDFNQLFIFFHTITFRNTYWLFDAKTDPIINLLPETYFTHCAIIILAFLVAGAFLQFFAYFFGRSHSRHRLYYGR